MSHLTNVRDGMIIPEQVDNIKLQRESPTYRLLVVPPTGSNSIADIKNASIDTYIEITPNVVNLNRSYLEYDAKIAAPANANWYNNVYKCKPNIQTLNIYTKSGINIVQIDYLNKMIWIIGRKNMKFADYMCRSKISTVNPIRGGTIINPVSVVGAGAAFTGDALPVSTPDPAAADPEVKSVAVAAANAYLLTTNLFNKSIYKRPDGSLVSDLFHENQYVEVGASNQALEFSVRFPLADVAETFLSLDKDIYLKENLIMKISWEPQQFVGYESKTNTAPTFSPPAPAPAVPPVALTTGYSLSNIQLRLAVQTNPSVIKSVMAAVDAGLTIDIPYVTLLRNPVNSSAQNTNIKINSGMGRTLLKVYHTFFNATESANTAFDNSNLNPADAANPLRIASYYTQLNSQRLQDYNLLCTTADGDGDDYQWNLDHLKNSAVFNHDVYRANWMHIDDFSNVNNNSEYKESQITNPGLPITNEFTWYFFGNTQGGGSMNLIHHSVVVTRRTITISPMGVQLQ